MDSSKPGSFFLRGTSAVSLHERFSQVLVDRLTQPRMVTFNPVPLQLRGMCVSPQVVLLMKGQPSSALSLQVGAPDSSVKAKQRLRRRKSVWTRLGGQQVTRRPSASTFRGFWSFRQKYRWRGRFTSTCRRPLQARLGQRHLLMKRNVQKVTAGQTQLRLHLPRGVATASMERGPNRGDILTKKQLDAQLDNYMSQSKRRLDQQLDDYWSQSRRRLDQQLDEYMSMAGGGAEGVWTGSEGREGDRGSWTWTEGGEGDGGPGLGVSEGDRGSWTGTEWWG